MADTLNPAFSAAQNDIIARKMAAANLVAQFGSRGQAIQDQQNAALAAQRQTAVRDALAASMQRNAPPALMEQNRATISAPYDFSRGELERGMANRRASIEQSGVANKNYLDQVAAALPLVQSVTQRKKDALDAAAKQQAERNALELQLAQLRLDQAQAKGAGGNLTDEQLKTRLLGAGELAIEQADEDRARLAPNRDAVGFQVDEKSGRIVPKSPGGITFTTPILQPSEQVAPPGSTRESAGRAIGIQAGLDPNRVAGLTVPKPAKPAPQNANQKKVASQAEALGAAGISQSQYDAAVRSNPDVWSDVIDTVKDARKRGLSPAALDEALARALPKAHKHDYPQMRKIARALFEAGIY